MQLGADMLKLRAGSRVAVIGGGPAGSFFVLHLLKDARALGLPLDVILFERRHFELPGPLGCNMCAGILSSRVVKGLQDLGLTIPSSVIMGRLQRYVLHWRRATVNIEQPDPNRQVLSVFRGAGPKYGALAPETSFDAFLLSQAEAAGATVIPERVLEVNFPPGEPAEIRSTHTQAAFDLVVLACGVNMRPPTLFGMNYRKPPVITMAQDEIRLNRPTEPNSVHVYCDEPPGLLFGGLVPKGEYINVSLLGHGLPGQGVDQFLDALRERGVLVGEHERLCGCRPRVATGPATDLYGDRFVAVGDAAVTRLYKDGIGSALQTAQSAAHVVLEHGIASQDFARHYAPVVRAIDRDNRYGYWLFRLWQLVKGEGILSTLGQRTLTAEGQLAPAQRAHSTLLWYMFTGDAPYRSIMLGLLSWSSLRNTLFAIWLHPAQVVRRNP
ncbi:MAG: NAD(P)/FAD-dependent oxidoreductase [Anaerolineae bacterium]